MKKEKFIYLNSPAEVRNIWIWNTWWHEQFLYDVRWNSQRWKNAWYSKKSFSISSNTWTLVRYLLRNSAFFGDLTSTTSIDFRLCSIIKTSNKCEYSSSPMLQSSLCTLLRLIEVWTLARKVRSANLYGGFRR